MGISQIIKGHQSFIQVLRALGKILYEGDSSSNVNICLTILIILCAEDGSIDENVNLPVECIVGLMQVTVIPCTESTIRTDSSINWNESVALAKKESPLSFSKKRKRINSSSSTLAESSVSNTISYLDSRDSIEYGDIYLRRDKNLPPFHLFFSTILPDNSRHMNSIEYLDIVSKELALMILSRIFVSKAQRSSTVRSNCDRVMTLSRESIICHDITDYQDVVNLEFDLVIHGTRQWKTYLDCIINDFTRLLELVLKGLNNDNATYQKDRNYWTLYQYLCLLEGLSYRNSNNQVYLHMFTLITSNIQNLLIL